MLFQPITLGLVGTMCVSDSRLLGRMSFERPLIMSTLIGLVLGDLEKGLLVGASLELMSLGLVSIGAAAPPDVNMASIITTAFTALSGSNAETALTIAIPISVLGQMPGILMRTVLSNLTHWADSLINKGRFSRAQRIHVIYGTALYSLIYFIPIFLAVYFGTDLVEGIVSNVPVWLINGLTLASRILPAYGFTLLLQTMLTKKMAPFLLLDFLVTAYSGLSIAGIAVFACIAAFVMTQVKFSGKDSRTAVSEPDPLDDL